MNLNQLQRMYAAQKASLFRSGDIDERFDRLQQREKYRNPNIISDSFDMFFNECEVLAPEIESAIVEMTPAKALAPLVQLKSRTSFLGAKKLNESCVKLMSYIPGDHNSKEYKDLDSYIGALETFKRIEDEIEELKNKLQPLMELEQAIVKAGGKF